MADEEHVHDYESTDIPGLCACSATRQHWKSMAHWHGNASAMQREYGQRLEAEAQDDTALEEPPSR